jgi:large subunit ribosomal protein L23
MSLAHQIIKGPILTELSIGQVKSGNVYTFKVDPKANKIEIARAVAEHFDVTVIKVNTLNVLPKFKRRGKTSGYTSAYKKAFVYLKKGDKIDAFVV